MKTLYILILLVFSCFISAQNGNLKKFNDEIYVLNNKHEYEQSIIKIYEVLYNPKSSHYEKYNAYLQKSLTYKRIYNFNEAYGNLNYALEEGLKTDKVKEVNSKIAIEKFFIIFDLQRFEKIREMINDNKNIDLSLIDEETKGLYLSALAIIEIIDGNYGDANDKINNAISIYEKVSPKDLPNIYGKKMFLYQKLNQPEKVEEAFRKAMYYAEKYKTDLYIKNLAINMWEFYTHQNNLEKAKYYREIADNLKEDDNTLININSLKLIELEKKLTSDYLRKEYEAQQKKQLLVIVGFVIVLGILGYLGITLFKNKKKRLEVESENLEIRKKLDEILFNSKNETEDSDFKNTNLTDRQLEIIELVKLGKTNKEIGAELYISENTVKYHLKIIYNTLGIENRRDLR